jgi:hypothetical protein
VIKLATKAEASKVEQWHVLDVYKDTKNLFGRAIVKELVVEGDSISARVMWDDGDSDNLKLSRFLAKMAAIRALQGAVVGAYPHGPW